MRWSAFMLSYRVSRMRRHRFSPSHPDAMSRADLCHVATTVTILLHSLNYRLCPEWATQPAQGCVASRCNMTALTTQQAAELTGKNRTTIWRACKAGRLSAARSEDGDFLIEPVELERVYGSLRAPQPEEPLHGDASQLSATHNEANVLRRENELLREQLRTLAEDKEDLRAERDRLLGVLERNTDQIRLLTDQREERERAAARPRSPLLARLFGRG
jgi:hypothetical protein